MKGKIPKTSLPGFHFCPDRKSHTPIFAMPGTPFANRKMQIIATAKIDASAYLPPVAAVILVCISMLLTAIAGLVPAHSAANKDPVVALRTE